jgi:hypothetical protein
MLQRLWAWLGSIGVVISLIGATVAACFAFLHPIDASFGNFTWAIIFATLLITISVIYWLNKPGLLLTVSISVVCITFLVVIVFSDNGPALLGLFWLILIAAGIGQWIIIRLLSFSFEGHTLEKLLLSIGLGFGVLAVITLGLSSFHYIQPYLPIPIDQKYFYLLRPIPVYLTLIILSILFLPGLFRIMYPLWARVSNEGKRIDLTGELFISLFLVCILGSVLWALAPTIRFDALSYHLGVPSIYVRAHGMVPVPEDYASFWVHYAEMLYTLALVLAGQPLPGLIHLIFGLLTAGLTFCLGRRLLGYRQGLLAAVLLFSAPIVSYETGTAYIDLIVTFYVFSTIITGMLWWTDQNPRWLILCGVFLGFSIGMKVSTLPLLLPFIFVMATLLVVYQKFSPALIRSLLHISIPAILIASPWFIRDYLWSGNPIFPMLNSIFHSPLWIGADIFTNGGNWLTIGKIITLPWTLTINSNLYYREGSWGMLGVLPLLSLPWIYSWYPKYSRALRYTLLALFCMTAIGTILLFRESSLARYLQPMFPLMSVLSVANLWGLWRLVSNKKFGRYSIIICYTLGFAYLYSTRLALTVRSWDIPERFPYTVAFGLEEPQHFLSRALPVYDALQYLNNQGDGNHKVLSVDNEFRMYTTSQIYGTNLSLQVANILKAKDQQDFTNFISDQGFDYLLVNLPRARLDKLDHIALLEPDLLSNYAILEYAQNNIYVYHLYPQGISAPAIANNMVKNPGFEIDNSSGQLSEWSSTGNISVVNGPSKAHSGQQSVTVTTVNNLYTTIPVDPNTLYTLGEWLRADPANQQARLQVMWLDSKQQDLSVSIDVIPVGKEWENYRMSVTAPDKAVSARIYITSHNNSSIRADDICFAAGQACSTNTP